MSVGMMMEDDLNVQKKVDWKRKEVKRLFVCLRLCELTTVWRVECLGLTTVQLYEIMT